LFLIKLRVLDAVKIYIKKIMVPQTEDSPPKQIEKGQDRLFSFLIAISKLPFFQVFPLLAGFMGQASYPCFAMAPYPHKVRELPRMR
jgi:hypothetical protein